MCRKGEVVHESEARRVSMNKADHDSSCKAHMPPLALQRLNCAAAHLVLHISLAANSSHTRNYHSLVRAGGQEAPPQPQPLPTFSCSASHREQVSCFWQRPPTLDQSPCVQGQCSSCCIPGNSVKLHGQTWRSPQKAALQRARIEHDS